jgi:hypothetical protein
MGRSQFSKKKIKNLTSEDLPPNASMTILRRTSQRGPPPSSLLFLFPWGGTTVIQTLDHRLQTIDRREGNGQRFARIKAWQLADELALLVYRRRKNFENATRINFPIWKSLVSIV